MNPAKIKSFNVTAVSKVGIPCDPDHNRIILELSGTYAGVTLQVLGGEGEIPLPIKDLVTGSTVTGSITPGTNAKKVYLIDTAGVASAKIDVTAISSGTLAVKATSKEINGDPIDVTDNDVTVAVFAADGAINIKSGVAVLTKATAGAYTLAAPAEADNGKRLLIVSRTAVAHTVTQTTPGFNGGGTGSDVATFGTSIGNCFELVAYNSVWHVVSLRNVTLG